MKLIRLAIILCAAAVMSTVQAIQPAPLQSTQAMRTQFETAPHYASFIRDALRRPQEGGVFYARIAYSRCQEVAALEPRHFLEREQSARRDQAITHVRALMDRCIGVVKAASDTLAASMPAITADAQKEVQSALATKDPNMIAATVELHSDHLAELSVAGYSPARHRRIGNLAAAGAACEIAGTCDKHLWVQIMCATGENCQYSDLRDFLRSGLSAGDMREFDAIKLALLKNAGR